MNKDKSTNLAEEFGILRSYISATGERIETTSETRDAPLEAMDVNSARLDRSNDLVRVVGRSEKLTFDKHGCVQLEDGNQIELNELSISNLPLGYHWFVSADEKTKTRIVVTPVKCPSCAIKIWGWGVQLYSLRSSNSWGIGDFSDLREFANWSRSNGANCTLINPLDSVAPTLPQEPSPYMPTSRRFLNPIYIRIEEVPGVSKAKRDLEDLANHGRSLNDSNRIRRDQVFALKCAAFRKVWASFSTNPEFDEFLQNASQSLKKFATFCALCQKFGDDYRFWPTEYRHPKSDEIHNFAKANENELRFYEWQQWIAQKQMTEVASESALIRDLPVGFSKGGFDAWEWRDILMRNVSIGVPPDHFNQRGQNWEFPPFNPLALKEVFYQPFIETLRAKLRNAVGLRIDHVMGLFRLFCIPDGMDPIQGAFVRFPAHDLLGILALECHRTGAWVVGEDLGTVSHQIRKTLAERQILSSKVFYFEDGLPSTYPENSLASINTHDLPTIAGVWSRPKTREVDVNDVAKKESTAKIYAKLAEATSLASQTPIGDMIISAYKLLADAPSVVKIASLEDGVGSRFSPNIPGSSPQTVPNWQTPLPETLESITRHPIAKRISQILS